MCAENDPEMDIYNLYGDSPNTPKTLEGDMGIPRTSLPKKESSEKKCAEQTWEKRGMSQCTALTVEVRQASTVKGVKVSALQEGLESTVP